jgi:hypothetical protein
MLGDEQYYSNAPFFISTKGDHRTHTTLHIELTIVKKGHVPSSKNLELGSDRKPHKIRRDPIGIL